VSSSYWLRPILHDHLSVFSAPLRTQHWMWRVAVGSGVAMAIMLPATLWMSFLPDPTAIPTLWVMGGADVDEFVEPGPVNTWDRAAIEFASYRAFYSSKVLTQNQSENLRSMVRAKAESSHDAPDFTQHPLRDSMTSLNRAHLNPLELNRATSGSLFSEILNEHPSHSLARRGRNMIR
jgi:hypothetical protein